MIDLRIKRRRAILAALDRGADADVDASIDELSLLLADLGVETVGRAVQKKRTPDPRTFLGRGKAEEIKIFAESTEADMLVLDDLLNTTQRSELAKVTGLEVWDRAFTIMMIFEQRATTAEAKLQVELAMLKYEIPSLKGLGHQMSRLGGGIGTRGPGETEFQRHRRKLERRMKFIERDLEVVRERRERARYRRARAGESTVSLVGYTNSGKSTMLRALSGDRTIDGEDKLFATLDTVTRRIGREDGDRFMLSDTVGFIMNLPPELISAFRATLEEASSSDALIVVADAASRDPMRDLETVLSTLDSIGAGEIPRVVALNKIDIAREQSVFSASGLASMGEHVVRVSARTGEGLEELTATVVSMMREASAAKRFKGDDCDVRQHDRIRKRDR